MAAPAVPRLRSLRRPAVLGAAVAVAAVVAVLAAVGGAVLTGAVSPGVIVYTDAGPLVHWGLPVVRAVVDLSCAVTIGALLLAAVALPVTHPDGRSPRAYPPAMAWAAISAAVWTLSGLVLTVLTMASSLALPLGDPGFGTQLLSFVRVSEPGQQLAASVLVAAVVATGAAAAVSLRSAGLLSVLALAGLIPPSLSGHRSGSSNHETAVTALGLHLLGVTVWVGALAALALLWHRLSTQREAATLAVQRFSTLAGYAFWVVAASGAVSAAIRIGSFAQLLTAYGVVVLLKSAALLGLGLLGARHRRATLPALASGAGRAFARLVAVELVVMGVAVGLAAALSLSDPPVPAVPPALPSLAQQLTGFPMPPPPTALRWLTEWQPDLLWLVIGTATGAWYVAAVIRLRRRGDAWPVLRTVTWLAGLVVLTWSTSGSPAVYGRVLFSGHMLGHMLLSMLTPMLLVMAAPVTLALRTLPARHDGSRGPREWLLALIESRYLRVLTNPVVAALLFAGSLIAFYYSDLLPLALTTHVGHEVMHFHFLAAGYLFMWVLMGVDPGPPRPAPPLRLLILLATMAFHAFFGVALMSGKTVLAPEYFGGLGRTWGDTLLADQQFGGGLAWGIGDLPTLAVALVIAIQWARTDDREARRTDRAADRDGDAELVAYNAMLGRLADHDRTH